MMNPQPTSAIQSNWQRPDRISDFLIQWMEGKEFQLSEAGRNVFRKYYKSYHRSFTPRLQYFYSRQVLEVSKAISEKKNPRLLDIGCGLGTESMWFSLLGADVTGLDLKSERLSVARERVRLLESKMGHPIPCKFECESVLSLKDSSGFDIIWMEQAFHHLEPREKILDHLTRLCRPGGKIIISDTNAWNPPMQLLLLARRGFSTLGEFEDEAGNRHPYGNERITTAGALRKSFEDRGFKIECIQHFRMFPNHPFFQNLFFLEKVETEAGLPLFSHFNLVAVKS